MQLTTHTDYSLRLLIYLGLSRDKAPATVQEIALSYGISANHIAKVAQTLTRLGYVKSLRGRGGGLVLAGDPERISVGEVVRQTENLKLLEARRRLVVRQALAASECCAAAGDGADEGADGCASPSVSSCLGGRHGGHVDSRCGSVLTVLCDAGKHWAGLGRWELEAAAD